MARPKPLGLRAQTHPRTAAPRSARGRRDGVEKGLRRHECTAAGASGKPTALVPAWLPMSRGACGPKFWHTAGCSALAHVAAPLKIPVTSTSRPMIPTTRPTLYAAPSAPPPGATPNSELEALSFVEGTTSCGYAHGRHWLNRRGNLPVKGESAGAVRQGGWPEGSRAGFRLRAARRDPCATPGRGCEWRSERPRPRRG